MSRFIYPFPFGLFLRTFIKKAFIYYIYLLYIINYIIYYIVTNLKESKILLSSRANIICLLSIFSKYVQHKQIQSNLSQFYLNIYFTAIHRI
jgi:hypothetical protein